MKKALFLALALLLVAGTAMAVTIVNSAHDLSSASTYYSNATTGNLTGANEICVFCHTPHNAYVTSPVNNPPLWNKNGFTTSAFNLYTSPTLDATLSQPNNGVGTYGKVSAACLTCHDGTLAVGAMYNPSRITPSVSYQAGNRISGTGLLVGPGNIGTNLANDHPIAFDYNAAGSGLQDIAVPKAAGIFFYGGATQATSSGVECASCHNVHDPGLVASYTSPFLRISNQNSAMCLDCHNK